MSRFVVVEVSGYRAARVGGGVNPGLSVHVQDTAYGYQVMGSWRSEDYLGKRWAEAKLRARRDARAAADRLNAAAEAARCPR